MNTSTTQTLVFPVGDGHQITATAWGNPDNPRALLLHGGGQTRHAWKSTGEHLEQMGYYTLAFDLPGHGDSSWHADGVYGVPRISEQFLTILDQLGGPIVLIGASLGGLITLRLTAQRPDLISALVLVDIVLRPNSDGTDRIVAFMQAHPDGFASLEEAADAVAAYLQHRDRPRDTSGLEKNLVRREDGRYHWHWDPRLLDTQMTGRNRVPGLVEEAEEMATTIRQPVLIIRGSKSDLVDDESLRHMQSLIPHAEVADVRDAAHMVAGESNSRFNQAMFDFLSQSEPSILEGKHA